MRLIGATALLLVVSATLAADPQSTTMPAESIYTTSAVAESSSPIDKAIEQQLSRLKITPAPLCSDAVFIRRAFLDAIGTLPTVQETRDFLADRSDSKRAKLIDQLLKRDEFSTYWAMKWSDLLRVKSEFPINLWPDAVQGYYTWIERSVRENKPYDRFARELLTASGSNFYAPEANFYRATQDRTPRGLASTVALTFMATRTEAWPKEKLDAMAEFFAPVAYKSSGEWKEEIVYCDLDKTADKEAALPDGKRVMLKRGQDPRQVFAEWLTSKDNPYFAQGIANRVWYWLLGRGIVHEPDDMRPDNPPANPELLSLLARELVDSNYDLKQLMRTILNSQAYQRASIVEKGSADAVANFAAYPVRRLDAEVLIDAICQVTGTSEKYTSPIPEPYTIVPDGQRSIALSDASINSSFLELFGRSPRATGLESERTNRISAAQRLHLLNSSQIQRKLENGPGIRRVVANAKSTRERATLLYLAILSRYPTEQELSRVEAYANSDGITDRNLNIDVAWALINSSEFLYRH